MGVYGGLIVIMMYAAAEQAYEQEHALLAQSNFFIFTQASQYIWAQVP